MDFRSRGPGFKTTCGRASVFSVEVTCLELNVIIKSNLATVEYSVENNQVSHR